MPLGTRTNRTAGPSQLTDQTRGSSPSPSTEEPLMLPRTRQPGVFVENMPPYRSPCHSPVLVVQSPSKHLGYKHAEFSFESPPVSPEPDVTILPNRGGLDIESTRGTTVPRDESDESEAIDRRFPQVRSASSSYPSEGMRSPAMTASPPMTFGRRVLSSLEAYGFSRAHLSSFLQSSESSAQGFQSCNETRVASEDRPRPDVADNQIWDFLAAIGSPGKKAPPIEKGLLEDNIHHEKKKTKIDPEDDHPGHKSLDNLARSASQMKKFDLPADLKFPNSFPGRQKGSRSITMSLMANRLRSSVDGPNASTICLPRASGVMEEARPQDFDDSMPHVEHCSQVSDGHSSLEKQYSSSDKGQRSTRRCSLRSRIGHYFQLRQRVKVKKWIVNKFSAAGKIGSRVVVRKVKERRARFVFSGSKASSSRASKTTSTRESQDLPAPLFHGGFHQGKKNSGSLGKSIRSIRKSVSGGLFGSGGAGASVGSVAGATRSGSGVLAGRRARVGKPKFRDGGSVDARS